MFWPVPPWVYPVLNSMCLLNLGDWCFFPPVLGKFSARISSIIKKQTNKQTKTLLYVGVTKSSVFCFSVSLYFLSQNIHSWFRYKFKSSWSPNSLLWSLSLKFSSLSSFFLFSSSLSSGLMGRKELGKRSWAEVLKHSSEKFHIYDPQRLGDRTCSFQPWDLGPPS